MTSERGFKQCRKRQTTQTLEMRESIARSLYSGEQAGKQAWTRCFRCRLQREHLYITAQSRVAESQSTGFVMIRSRITADDLQGRTFALGRPWRDHAKVVVIHSELPDTIDPKGWSDWGRDPKDVDYGEGANTGPGAALSTPALDPPPEADGFRQLRTRPFPRGRRPLEPFGGDSKNAVTADQIKRRSRLAKIRMRHRD